MIVCNLRGDNQERPWGWSPEDLWVVLVEWGHICIGCHTHTHTCARARMFAHTRVCVCLLNYWFPLPILPLEVTTVTLTACDLATGQTYANLFQPKVKVKCMKTCQTEQSCAGKCCVSRSGMVLTLWWMFQWPLVSYGVETLGCLRVRKQQVFSLIAVRKVIYWTSVLMMLMVRPPICPREEYK